MRSTELAQRYAKALYHLAAETKEQDKVLSELRTIMAVIEKDDVLREFLTSPLLSPETREAAIVQALETAGVSLVSKQFLSLLARKNRLGAYADIVQAFEDEIDHVNGVVRGTVRSATVLSPDERKRIEEIVSRFTKQQVILKYKEDQSVIGGLIATVGSHTFDDTLTSHLRRLKDQIKRSSH